MTYDLVIIGGGPAGIAAGIYAARKRMKALLITDSFGGQSIAAKEIQNWTGIRSISGFELAKSFEEHLRSQDIEILDGDQALEIEKGESFFNINTKNAKRILAKTILIATGAKRRSLGIAGEKEFVGKGVSYCAICDAPFFKNKIVAVVGGGNAGVEAAVDLSEYASKIYLLEMGDKLTADLINQEKIKNNSKVIITAAAQAQKISGGPNGFVVALEYKDLKSGQIQRLDINGIFIESGSVPNSEIARDLVKLNERKEIIVDHKTQQTSLSGIWAAGDVADNLYKQIGVAVGDGIKAALNICEHINNISNF